MRFTDCISRRRTELMGCAILLIICFHSYARLPGGLWRYVVRENGNIGVDFFALMSGFGCVFSLKKSRDIGPYYARRLRRLLPLLRLHHGDMVFPFDVRDFIRNHHPLI